MVVRRIAWFGLALLGCANATEVGTSPSLLATRSTPAMVARDLDQDGVVDASDRCPTEAGPIAGCPDQDSDSDGVLDSQDGCPRARGEQADGCPIPDTDRDAIPDPVDECREQRETKNGFEDVDGCPDELPADLAAMTGTIHGLKFDLDKDTFKRTSFAVLDRAAEVYRKYPEVRIEISGHIDSTGDAMLMRSNLSARRARSVMRYLVAHGIAADRIETRGAGPDEPVDTHETAAGRAKDQRIEFTILVR